MGRGVYRSAPLSYSLDSLVGEGSGTRNNTDLAVREDLSGHDTELAGLGENSGAVASNHARLALRAKGVVDLELVTLGDTLSDSDNEGDLVLDSLKDGIGGARRGNVDDGGEGVLGVDGLLDGAEDGETEVGLAGLL